MAERLGRSNINMTADTYAAVLPYTQQQATENLHRLLAEG